ncbi:universal stress protein [Flavihumibacter petaseus]|uniref:UspA domain-containing protein n=1 Tax=Flavihumibacter petaseus NBRC 106054 TaxID=1220578 RepID=A0A0E9MVK4_9BACT|nr:universal stress protein [Flavihumibacter petaseus]GAO41160.1 hypothetical protein FPE01S_01_01720 [Flavihumibacter petaseus NBRC 106054]
MKTILIPTDFSASSFAAADYLLENLGNEKVNLYFFHAFSLPESEQDVVDKTERPHLAVLSESFRRECCRLKNNHPNLVQAGYRFLYGNSKKQLRNFIEYNNISHYFLADGQNLSALHPRSLDLSGLIRKELEQVEVLREIYSIRLRTGRVRQEEPALETASS